MLGSYVDPKGSLNPGSGGAVGSWAPNVRYEDMNATNGGVARDTNIGAVYTTVYEQTGNGLFIGYLITLENAFDEWDLRLTIDGTNVIYEINTKDIESSSLYGYEKGGDNDLTTFLGLSIHDKTIRWQGPLDIPVAYTSSVKLDIRYSKGGNKKFRAGLAARTL